MSPRCCHSAKYWSGRRKNSWMADKSQKLLTKYSSLSVTLTVLISINYKYNFLSRQLNENVQTATLVQSSKSECLLKLSEHIKSPLWTGSLLKTSISCEISGTYLSGACQKHHFCGVTVSNLDGNYNCQNKNSLYLFQNLKNFCLQFGSESVKRSRRSFLLSLFFLFFLFPPIPFVSFESVRHYLRWNVPIGKRS